MFRNGLTCARNHKGRAGGYIIRALGVAAGAAGVDGPLRRHDIRGLGAHGLRRTGNFFNRWSFFAQA